MLLPHRLEFRASRLLALALALLHLCALGSLLPLQISLWLKFALAVPIALSLCAAVRRHALHLSPSSVREILLKADGTVEGCRRDGGRFEATVSGQTTVLPWLIVMLLEHPHSRQLQPVVILPDALPEEDGRILRTWLRWKTDDRP